MDKNLNTVEDIKKEIARLKEEHAAQDARVIAFDQQAWLSPDEQVERKECQKMKLKLKDEMAALTKKLKQLEG